MVRRLADPISVRLSPQLKALLQADAEQEGADQSEIVRRIVGDYYKAKALENASGQIEEVLGKVLQPYLLTLTELTVHAGVTGGTAAWLSKAVLKKIAPEIDSDAALIQAEVKAKEGVRRLRLTVEDDDE